MSEYLEFKGKTVDDAVSQASIELNMPSNSFEYEVIEKESKGFLGINNKMARIRVIINLSVKDRVKQFLEKVLFAMNLNATVEITEDEEENTLNIELVGDDMGVLIGKRGQTLDSLQYLASLIANKGNEEYIKIKLDTENYRERRKATLEGLAKNVASKVKRTHSSVELEPMNPYERRIIHSALQNDKFVETHSEGEEPFRKVIVSMKKGVHDNSYRGGNNSHYRGKGNYSGRKGGNSYSNRGGYRKSYSYSGESDNADK